MHAAGRCSEAGSRYLLAQCCFSLGKYAEAEEALLGPAQPSYLPSGGSTTPGGAAGLYLLGRICRYGKMAAVTIRRDHHPFLHWGRALMAGVLWLDEPLTGLVIVLQAHDMHGSPGCFQGC